MPRFQKNDEARMLTTLCQTARNLYCDRTFTITSEIPILEFYASELGLTIGWDSVAECLGNIHTG
jgi:hypothetical protein